MKDVLISSMIIDWSSSWVSSWHFEPESRSSRVAHIFNSTRVELLIFSTWRDSTRLVKDPSLASRELNIEIFPVFDFCIIFLHYLLIENHEGEHEESHGEEHEEEHEEKHEESHDGEHEGKHEESHGGEHEGKSWREVMVESHDGKPWRLFGRKVW